MAHTISAVTLAKVERLEAAIKHSEAIIAKYGDSAPISVCHWRQACANKRELARTLAKLANKA